MDLIAGLKELNNTTMGLKAISMEEEKEPHQHFGEFFAAWKISQVEKAKKEVEEYKKIVERRRLEGAKVDGFITEYLNTNIDDTKLNQWREALVNYDSTINASFDADIYIYEKLFANKNHTINRETGQRIEEVEWDDDDVGGWDDDDVGGWGDDVAYNND